MKSFLIRRFASSFSSGGIFKSLKGSDHWPTVNSSEFSCELHRLKFMLCERRCSESSKLVHFVLIYFDCKAEWRWTELHWTTRSWILIEWTDLSNFCRNSSKNSLQIVLFVWHRWQFNTLPSEIYGHYLVANEKLVTTLFLVLPSQ